MGFQVPSVHLITALTKKTKLRCKMQNYKAIYSEGYIWDSQGGGPQDFEELYFCESTPLYFIFLWKCSFFFFSQYLNYFFLGGGALSGSSAFYLKWFYSKPYIRMFLHDKTFTQKQRSLTAVIYY